MNMNKSVLASAIAVISILLSGCDAKPDAPFGLKWGESVNSLLKRNLNEAKVSGSEDTIMFVNSKSAPDPAPYNGRYHFAFLPDIGLYAVSYSAWVDENGVFFNQGKEVYNSISKKLQEKYGPPSAIRESVKRDGIEFYSCLKEDGCGEWSRDYQYKGMTVTLVVEPAPGRLMDGFAKGSVNVKYSYLTEDMKKKEIKKMKANERANNF